MCLDELTEDVRGEEWRVAGKNQDVVGSAFEDRPRAANGVSRAARLFLHRDFEPVERRGVRRRSDDDERIDSELARRP